MTYAMAAGLQSAIYQRLAADAALAALVGDAVFDGAPVGNVPPLYISLGAEEVRERDDKTGRGAIHLFTLSVIAEAAGFHAAKLAGQAAADALEMAPLTLTRGRCISLRFQRARARREGNGARRRIDLRFRAALDDIND